jgi:hypothetical protein
LALGLLGLAGTALAGGGSTGTPADQAAYDAIARGRSPVYPGGGFTPMPIGNIGGIGGIPGVYDYFGPYYGAGRFGARPQAFDFPLMSPTSTASTGFTSPTMPPTSGTKQTGGMMTQNPNEGMSFMPTLQNTPGIPLPPSGSIIQPESQYAPYMSSDNKWLFNDGKWYPNEMVTTSSSFVPGLLGSQMMSIPATPSSGASI